MIFQRVIIIKLGDLNVEKCEYLQLVYGDLQIQIANYQINVMIDEFE